MFIGHIAVGFAAKRAAPRASLGVLMTAPVLLDLGSFVALLVLAYVADINGPPPPSPEALRNVGFLTWLFVPWAFWIDRTRELRTG